MTNTYSSILDVTKALNLTRKQPDPDLPVVCIQGLGFVGTAMAIAVATAMDDNGNPCFNVIGVDLPNPMGEEKVNALNTGILPIESTDPKLQEYYEIAHNNGNLIATTDASVFSLASTILVDVHLDVIDNAGEFDIGLTDFRKAIATVGSYMQADCLVVIETTVPPGACEYVVVPELKKAFESRGLPTDNILVAHSYERVMPGNNYLNSIINFWRVFSGYTEAAADRCEAFMSKVINVDEYPLTRLHSTNASETSKVLENSFRAMNIAFIEEWSRFAEAAGIDLFEVINAIRIRPTHKNIMQPGFGVGGYCLTKDPLFAELAAEKLFGLKGIEFPFCKQAVMTNREMPLVSLDKLRSLFNGSLENKKILLLGVSYRQDVGDTRYSPSETFVVKAQEEGAKLGYHDPLVPYWHEMKSDMPENIPDPKDYDAIVFALPHKEYTELDIPEWLGDAKPIILDANNVLSHAMRDSIRSHGISIHSIGRGEGL